METASRIFNVSLGAVRSFLATSLSSLGKTGRKDMRILADFPMQPGDLYVLEGDVNKRFGHGVARDPTVKDLRVSWFFVPLTLASSTPSSKPFVKPVAKITRYARAIVGAQQRRSPPRRSAADRAVRLS